MRFILSSFILPKAADGDDPEGEYLACKAASPAWKICGKSPLPDVPWPGDFDLSAIGPDIGYYRRSQKHGISFFDWLQVIRFAQRWN